MRPNLVALTHRPRTYGARVGAAQAAPLADPLLIVAIGTATSLGAALLLDVQHAKNKTAEHQKLFESALVGLGVSVASAFMLGRPPATAGDWGQTLAVSAAGAALGPYALYRPWVEMIARE